MELDSICISELIPSDYNPRKMAEAEMNKLSKNLEKFGLVDPIIINLKNNHIISGHQRYTILSSKYNQDTQLNLIKLGDIGWVFDDTKLKIDDLNHEKALNLSLNSIDGEFDIKELGAVLSDLQLESFDVELTGFNDIEILDYTLDYELEKFNEKEKKTTPDLDNPVLSDVYTTNIYFSSQTQKNKFMQFIEKLKKENQDKTIGTLLLGYITEKSKDTQHKKIKEYNILFDNKEQKKVFDKYYKQIKEDYNTDPLLNFIDYHVKS